MALSFCAPLLSSQHTLTSPHGTCLSTHPLMAALPAYGGQADNMVLSKQTLIKLLSQDK